MYRVREKENIVVMREDELQNRLRDAVRFFEDAQSTRIQCGNRLYAMFKSAVLPKEEDVDVSDVAIHVSVPEELLDEDEEKRAKEMAKEEKKKKEVVKVIMGEYSKIKDSYEKSGKNVRIPTYIRRFKDSLGCKYIVDEFGYRLCSLYETNMNLEEYTKDYVATVVKSHPMWELFFKDVKGIGPGLAGKMLAQLNIHTARHVSAFFAYCGLAPRYDEKQEKWVGMSKRTLIEKEYIDRYENVKVKKDLGYNPKMQSVMTSLVTSSVLRTAKGSKYWHVYNNYKNRYSNRADLKDASKLRIHLMTQRKVGREILRDLWTVWRSYEGYDVTLPYEVEYLNRAPHLFNEAQVEKAIECGQAPKGMLIMNMQVEVEDDIIAVIKETDGRKAFLLYSIDKNTKAKTNYQIIRAMKEEEAIVKYAKLNNVDLESVVLDKKL